MIIRIVLLSALAAIGYLGIVRRNRLPFHIVLVLALLTVAALAVLFPDKTNVVAAWVGVGRGADLIGYIVQVTLLFVSLHYYTKFVHLQHQITHLVRELALLRVEIEARDHPSRSGQQPDR